MGGLSWNTTDDSLRRAFEEFGEVTEARVVYERDTGRSRGFAFVSFKNVTDGDAAISKMDGADLDGRQIRVSESNSGGPRRGGAPRGRDFGGRGDRGGFGGRDRDGYRDSRRDGGYGGRDSYDRGHSRYNDRR